MTAKEKTYPILPNGTYDIPKEDIKGFECVFGTYTESCNNKTDDLVTVKEKVHLKDGQVLSQLRFIKNFKRDFYITKEGYRSYKQKKEYEELSKLQKFTTTQRNLTNSVSRAMGRGPAGTKLSIICRSPYIYGTDISTTALIKQRYMHSNEGLIAPHRVAVLDLETNVFSAEKEILSGTISLKEQVFLVVTEDFKGTIPNFEEKVQNCMHKYIGDHVKKRNITLTVEVVPHEGEVAKRLIEKAHEWKPDFVAAWNIKFDMNKLITALDRHNYDKAAIFSDPLVPSEYQYFKFKEAPKIKQMASGKSMPLHPADLWHVVTTPSSHYWIDLMCLYKLLRVTEGNQPSYGLDAILKRHDLGGKLKFEEADGYTNLAWHKFMQKNYKVEYLVYNIFDCISVEMLEELNNDTGSLSTLCKYSDFSIFKSTPRRLCDDLHFFYLDRNKVIASKSDSMEEVLDPYVVSRENWINEIFK